MNEVAEKIKEEFDISLMPSDRITLVWEDCEKFLQKSCNRSNGRATTKEIFVLYGLYLIQKLYKLQVVLLLK